MMVKTYLMTFMLLVNLLKSPLAYADNVSQAESQVTITVVADDELLQSSSEDQAKEEKTTKTAKKKPIRLPQTSEDSNFIKRQLLGIYLLFFMALYKIKHKKENKNEKN